jgi:hypothetical protein
MNEFQDKLRLTYQNSKFRNDFKVFDLDKFDFIAFLWQLYTGRFNITGFSTKGFKYYLLAGDKSTIKFINEIDLSSIYEAKLFLTDNYCLI